MARAKVSDADNKAAAKEAAAALEDGKFMNGVAKGKIWRDVFAANPSADAESLLKKLIEEAKGKGYEPKFDFDFVQKKLAGGTTTTTTRRQRNHQDDEDDEPTLSDVLKIKEYFTTTKGADVESFLAVLKTAEELGGISKVKACLEALEKLRD